jgi:hypothetical protein
MTQKKWSRLYEQYKKVYNFENFSIPGKLGYMNNIYKFEDDGQEEQREVIAF